MRAGNGEPGKTPQKQGGTPIAKQVANLQGIARGMKKAPSIEQQILNHLASYPNAQDTLRGIVEWWLRQQRIVQTTAEVEAALRGLVARGKLSMKTGPDGRVHYCHPGRGRRASFSDN